MIRFEIPGEPVAKGRPRMTKTGHTFTAKKTVHYEAVVASYAEPHFPVPLDGPLSVSIVAIRRRPKGLLRKKDPDGVMWATKRPDADNYVKAILDGMQDCWRDDAQVVDCRVLKLYAEKDGKPRVIVTVQDAGEAPLCV